MEAKKAAD
jgi:hypothetical protein